MTNNQVVAKSVIDENLVRTTTYENVNGNFNVSGSISYSKEIKLDSIKKVRLRLSMWTNIRRAVNFFNETKYASLNTSYSPSLSVNFSWKDILEIDPRYTISMTKSTFDIDQLNNQNFTGHRLGLRTKLTAPKKLEWRNNINYQYNPNVAPGFQRSSWFWNATLSIVF